MDASFSALLTVPTMIFTRLGSFLGPEHGKIPQGTAGGRRRIRLREIRRIGSGIIMLRERS